VSVSRKSFCGSPEHTLDRRLFLQGGIATALGVGLAGLEAPLHSLCAGELRQKKKHVLLLWLAGGSSQLETWDPKPGRPTGGPFKSIPTTVPGVQICELMPKMARMMDRVALVRSLDTRIGDHGQAADLVQRGRRPEAELAYPDFGSVVAKELGQRDSQIPEYVSLYLATEGQPWGRPNPGFLGGRYAATTLERSLKPDNLTLPPMLSDKDHTEREHLRQYLSERFNRGRDAEEVQGYNSTYARVRGLMQSDSLFDLEREPAAVRDRYGPTDFGQHALIARRLLEAGVPMVKVGRAWWDSHADNFESHRELVAELDHVMSTLLLDLQDRGLLQSTLVVTLSEFGRTPAINKDVGRDHFASAWSCSFTGCGIRGGAVHGRTDPDGKAVVDGKVDAGDVVATIFQAVGINPKKSYRVGPRPVPLVPEGSKPIKIVLA
jgi:hypothetical protein